MEPIRYQIQIGSQDHRIKFFERPHPLGGVTYAFNYLIDNQSQGLVEARDKETVLSDFYKLQQILESENRLK